ncbi:MAG TPA: hypothetical protein VJY33_20565 [Isosphaeraceae bacterium]|nr:hypothetical protein [Isosphaeraceae bacterium]
MELERGRFSWTLPIGIALAMSLTAATASAGDGPGSNLLPEWINPFHFGDPATASRPLRMSEIGNWIDHVGEKIRDDGIVAVKQPDIFSQARLTKYRKDFEEQMSAELTKFQFVLSARIARLDAATTTSTTSLGAALAPPGTTSVTAPQAPATPQFGPGASLDLSKTPFANLTVGQGSGQIGVEPTVFLDEKKRFLDHLNEIRRVSIGPDQSDSAGYSLYLMRLPVSITPGECTYQGHGADMAVTLEHEFGKSFLPSTIRNLVVNDLVAQLGPVIYEIIRNGTLEKIEKKEKQLKEIEIKSKELESKLTATEAKRRKLLDELGNVLVANLAVESPTIMRIVNKNAARRIGEEYHSRKLPVPSPIPMRYDPRDAHVGFDDLKSVYPKAEPYARYLTRFPPAGQSLTLTSNAPLVMNAVAERLDYLRKSLIALQKAKPEIADNLQPMIDDLQSRVPRVRGGDAAAYSDLDTVLNVQAAVSLLISNAFFVPPPAQQQKGQELLFFSTILKDFLRGLYDAALPDDVGMLDAATGATREQQEAITKPLATESVQLAELRTQTVRLKSDLLPLRSEVFEQVTRTLPSTRNPKQSYPISPREVPDFFFRDNLILLAKDAQRAMLTKTPRATEVRNYLRQTLYIAFDAMSKPVDDTSQPPLLDQALMDQILTAVLGRRFGEGKDEPNSPLRSLQNILLANLQQSQSNIAGRPIGALCWAVAVDTVLLDAALREDVRKVLSDKGASCCALNKRDGRSFTLLVMLIFDIL